MSIVKLEEEMLKMLFEAVGGYKELEDKWEVQNDSPSEPRDVWKNWVLANTPEKKRAKEHCQLLYIFNELQSVVILHSVRLLKRGGLGKPQPTTPSLAAWSKYADEKDAAVLLQWKKNRRAGFNRGGNASIDIEYGSADLLSALIDTGRLVVESDLTRPIVYGEEVDLRVEWKLGSDGKYEIHYHAGEGKRIVRLDDCPWYFDREKSTMGPAVIPSAETAWPLLKSAPKVDLNEVAPFRNWLKEHQLASLLPLPVPLNVKKKEVVPVPRLLLFGVPFGENDIAAARVQFQYEQIVVDENQGQNHFFSSDARHALKISRNHSLEEERKKELQEKLSLVRAREVGWKWGFSPMNGDHFVISYQTKKEDKTIAMLTRALPQLRKMGWKVIVEDSFPFTLIDMENHEIYMHVNAATNSDNKWFDVELTMDINGQSVNLLPILVNLIQSHSEIFNASSMEKMTDNLIFTLPLPDGSTFQLPLNSIKGVLTTFLELQDARALKNGRLQIPALRSTELLSLSEQKGVVWKTGKDVKQFAEKLRQFKGIAAVPPPSDFNATLRPYQQQGLNWLQFLREYGVGGILADDMGLGKTVQTLAHLLVEKKSGRATHPSIIVSPTSLIANWKNEAARFAPQLTVLTLHGSERKEHFERIDQVDLILTSYPLLFRDQDVLLKQPYHAVILDEAHVIKNHKTQAASICRQMEANHRICLTGTPMENNLEELWSLCEFANAGLLGNIAQFRRLFRNPIEKEGAQSVRQSLSRRIAPFVVRRTKEEVVLDLPKKTEMVRRVELGEKQKELYESIRLAVHDKVKDALMEKGLSSSQIVILDALLKLRQVCCDPRLVPLESAKKVTESAKFEMVTDMLSELVSENRRVLLFSSFSSMLKLIEQHLQQQKIAYSCLTGQTKDREREINAFQQGDHPLFLISLKAGGVGLNLTAADTVIHYDPWWNPAAEKQATDRAYRIGQDKPVFVYKLITSFTVEDKILALQEKKKQIVDSFFNATANKDQSRLSSRDLEYLFEPLQ